MPAYWSPKDERMYQHIVESCRKSRTKRRTIKKCREIAARTVNAQRRREGRTR